MTPEHIIIGILVAACIVGLIVLVNIFDDYW